VRRNAGARRGRDGVSARGFPAPTRLRLGDDALDELEVAPELADGPVALVTGREAARGMGYVDEAVERLGTHEVVVLDIVEPQPSDVTVAMLAAAIAERDARTVVALGGGSALDAAKVATCMAGTDGKVGEYMERRRRVGPRTRALIAIPTTGGTGSEVTPYAVLTDRERGRKRSLTADGFAPDLALVVPRWLATVPKVVRGDVGLDALAHAFEALWSINAGPVSDRLAYAAIIRLHRALLDYYEHPEHHLLAMAEGATLAGLAFAQTQTAGCHAVSYALCDALPISHGAACGTTLAVFAELNRPAVMAKFEKLASLLDPPGGDVVASLATLRARIPTIPRLGELGVERSDLPGLARGAFPPLLANNPVDLTDDVLVRVLERCL
jgi:alcohol dehydrogenase